MTLVRRTSTFSELVTIHHTNAVEASSTEHGAEG